MQLIKTKVIPAASDRLWTLPDALPELTGSKLLVISQPFDEGSPEAATLGKMMSACRLGPGDYVVVRLNADEQISWQLLAGAGAPPRTLLLGINPSQLGISAVFLLNHCNPFMGCSIIPSYTLERISQDAAIKRALWEGGLKPCFGL